MVWKREKEHSRQQVEQWLREAWLAEMRDYKVWAAGATRQRLSGCGTGEVS